VSEVRANADGWIRSGMVRYFGDLEPLMRDIDAVSPAPWNYNNGDVELIVESIEQTGMYRPVFAQLSTGQVIAGNHTWMACKALGAQVIPIVYLDVDDQHAKELAIRDNEIARKSKPDPGLLEELLDELKELNDHELPPALGITEAEHNALKALNDIPLDTSEFASWPSILVQVPPNVYAAYLRLTEQADKDWQRVEMLLRMAGWDGK
jgi:ParB-like chromosome segregation protein Spo0J